MAVGFFSFEEVLVQWESMGVFNVIMPFMLFFLVFYGILDKAGIFGKNRQGLNAVIAIVLSFFTIRSPQVIAVTSKLFSNMAIGVSILLVLLILFGFVLNPEKNKMWFMLIFITTAIVIFSIIVTNVMKDYVPAAGFDIQAFLLSPQMLLLYVVIALLLIVVFPKKETNWVDKIGHFLQKEV